MTYTVVEDMVLLMATQNGLINLKMALLFQTLVVTNQAGVNICSKISKPFP